MRHFQFGKVVGPTEPARRAIRIASTTEWPEDVEGRLQHLLDWIAKEWDKTDSGPMSPGEVDSLEYAWKVWKGLKPVEQDWFFKKHEEW